MICYNFLLYVHYIPLSCLCCSPSYELVRLLQRRIDGVVGPLVESKVEERALEGDGHGVVAQITDEVFSSAE